MSVPPSLEYFCDRLEGLSVGIFRLESQSQNTSIQPQSIIRFTLPSNAYVDMRSFAFRFNAQTSTGAGTIAYRLPNNISSLINRVEVSIGGVAVASGANFYNVLCHAKAAVDSVDAKDAGMNHPEIIPALALDNYVDGVALTTAEVPVSTNFSAQFTIDEWNGFIGSCEPSILDTSCFGDLQITIYLEQASNCITSSNNYDADANFIVNTAANAAPSYTLNNIYATIKCYALSNGVVDNLVMEQMSRNGNIEVGFHQYFSFRDRNTGSSRFTVATQSLDRIFVAHHANVQPVGATLAPIKVSGYNGMAATNAGRTLDFSKAKYIAPYIQFKEPTAVTNGKCLFEYQLNGAKYPQFRATAEDLLYITRQSRHVEETDWGNMGLQQYKDSYFVSCIKLTLDSPNARFIQGLDTRSVSLNGYYYIYNMSTNCDITLFCEVTSSLLISAGRQIAVVQ